MSQLHKNLFAICAALICCLLLLSTLRIVPAGAQPQPSTDGSRSHDIIERQIETFFLFLRSGNTNTAFADLLNQSPLNAPAAAAEVAHLQSRVDDLNTRFGGILHWDRLDTRQLGTDVIVMRYILKYDRFPVIWSFAFYRKPSPTTMTNPNTWVVVELQFDTNLLFMPN